MRRDRDLLAEIMRKQRPGHPLRLRTRLRLRAWQRRQYRGYLASLNHERPPPISGGLLGLTFRIVLSYGVAGLVLGIAIPHVGLGYGLLLAVLAWIVMGAYWLS